MNKLIKLLKWFAALFIITYSGVCIYFYVIQDDIIFRPTQLELDYTYSYPFRFEERYFKISDEVNIHAIKALSDSSRGLVIYFHGNRGSNETDPVKFEMFLSSGYDVLYPDYRSYGKSSGTLTNGKDLIADMVYVYKEMLSEYDQDQIIILGYSLGSGFAAEVAAEFDPKSVIIWAPYFSMIDLKDATYPFFPDLLVRFPLRTNEALKKVEEPVYIFYAAEDEVLPIERSLPLTQYLKEKDDKYFVLEGQGHGRIYLNPVLQREMKKILN